MKIYIAGKITGDTEYKTKFQKAEDKLRGMGHSVMNPAWIQDSPEFSWNDYMAVTEAMQKCCDAVYLLPDWQDSKGAVIEYKRAKKLRQTVCFTPEEFGQES